MLKYPDFPDIHLRFPIDFEVGTDIVFALVFSKFFASRICGRVSFVFNDVLIYVNSHSSISILLEEYKKNYRIISDDRWIAI